MFKDFHHHAVADPQLSGWQAYVVDQGWTRFSAEDHETWDILHARQTKLLHDRIVAPFFDGLAVLGDGGIPELGRLNERLAAASGWRCVAVAGLVPDAAFFAMLAERVFPIGNFIRTRAQLDYLEEPDCFHDIYGHVPMLAHRPLADAMQAFGEQGMRAIAAGEGDKVARLYWYTVEFGLCREKGETRILGAGLASSFGEAAQSLEDERLERRRLTIADAVGTPYRNDVMQPLYMVADDLDQVVEVLRTGLA